MERPVRKFFARQPVRFLYLRTCIHHRRIPDRLLPSDKEIGDSRRAAVEALPVKRKDRQHEPPTTIGKNQSNYSQITPETKAAIFDWAAKVIKQPFSYRKRLLFVVVEGGLKPPASGL